MQKASKKLPQVLQLKDYWLVTPSVQRSMLIVCLALGPGIFSSLFFFGFGMLSNIILAIFFGLLIELVLHHFRGHSVKDFPFEGSGAVMAIIFALSLPASIPWWILLFGIFFAIAIGKYAYGGTGNNVFNPAMVGVVALLLSFPTEMNQWQLDLDGLAGATPFDHLQTSLRLSQMISEMDNAAVFGLLGASGHEWINLAFLMGGLVLIHQKVIRWQIPLGVLTGILITASLFHTIDSDVYTGAFFNLFGGATMLCAFFVSTDPVTSPVTAKGRFIYGCLIGLVIYGIRTWGNYPEGVAFAVLMMNATVPLLDFFTRPKAPV